MEQVYPQAAPTYSAAVTSPARAVSRSGSAEHPKQDNGQADWKLPAPLTVNLPPAARDTDTRGDDSRELTADADGFVLPPEQRKKLIRQNKRNNADDQKRRTKPAAVYGTRQDTTLRSGPRRFDLFVFRVHNDITDEDIKLFLNKEDVTVRELEILSSDNAWTKSYRVSVETKSIDMMLQPEFWPDGIGCRRFWRKSLSK